MTSLTILSDYDKSLTSMSDYAKSLTILSDYDKSWTILSDYDKSWTLLRGPCEVDRTLKSGYCFILWLLAPCLWLLAPCLVGAFTSRKFFFFSFFCSLSLPLLLLIPFISWGKFGLHDLGEATSATRATLHVPASACSIFMCPDNGIAASVWADRK